jgi:hypothetical protein
MTRRCGRRHELLPESCDVCVVGVGLVALRCVGCSERTFFAKEACGRGNGDAFFV